MDYVQIIFSTFSAPLFAVVGLAALAPRRAAGGGMGGFLCGLVCAIAQQVLVHAGFLHFGSQMSANVYTAILGFSVAAVSTPAITWARRRHAPIASDKQAVRSPRASWAVVTLALTIAAIGTALNVLFW